jgi:hypothetical protein
MEQFGQLEGSQEAEYGKLPQFMPLWHFRHGQFVNL